MRNKVLVLFTLTISVMIFLPNIAYAGWVEEKIGDGIAYVLTLIFKPIFDSLIKALQMTLNSPTNLEELPFIPQVMHGMRYLAYTLLGLNLTFRAWRYQTGGVRGEVEPMSDILFRAGISAILIYALPEILNYILRLNEAIMNWLASLGIDFGSGLKLLAFPMGGGSALVLILFFIIFVIALVGLTISNAIRIAELAFLFAIAPIIAVSHSGKGESLQIWIMQAVAVSFTQSVQFGLVGFALNLVVNININEWWTWIAPVGAVVLAIRGPQVIKQYLYSSGVSGFSVGMAQTAMSYHIYSRMMKVRG
jgi:hypothetical protein